jgi:beta-lactamase superfamily II metal-dependent hydrolase
MAENFVIYYYYMGQGDCILIVCPDGRLVMIDCGSAKGLGAHNVDLMLDVCTHVRKVTSKNKGKVNTLILTHKDRDHYNQVKQIFSARTITEQDGSKTKLSKVNIDNVYFSSPTITSTNYALTQFSEGSCGDTIVNQNHKTKSINQVFINATEKKIVTYKKDSNFLLSAGVTTPLQNLRRTLLSSTTPAGKDWSVVLIAGQVPETDGNSDDPTNALSLVTLLKIGDSKALFLGDATAATESFLKSYRKTLITDVDFVHIPHHGSRTSSTKSFVKAVNPTGAQVTHETYETGNRLPKEDVLDRWLAILQKKDSVETHAIDYWQQLTPKKYDEIVADWKKNQKTNIDKTSNGWFLITPPKTGWIFIYRTVTQYWGLFRKRTDLNLWGTGATGFVRWTLPL